MRCKLVLLGDSSAGKSSLVLRYIKNSFFEFQEATIGAAFFTHNIRVEDRSLILEIWDTAGQERYHSLAPMYYRGASASIVAYDITNMNSFNRAKIWVNELRRNNPNVIIGLSGNKCDLESQREVSYEEAEFYANENDLIFMETSAKNNINIEELFYEIAKNIPEEDLVPQTKILDFKFEEDEKSYCCT